MGTLRQQMIDLLSRKPQDISALAQALAVKEKEAISHLPHIAKSVAGRGGRLSMRPAHCEGCGFQFKDRRRLSPPSRCPCCKSSRILGPWYEITGLERTED